MKNCIDGFPGCARIGIYDSWVSRVCKDWHLIQLQDWKKDSALEMRDLTELHSARNFMRSKGDFQRRQHGSS